mgnify:FL=1
MNKLFVFQDNVNNDYRKELEYAYEICKNNSQRIEINNLSVDYLINHSIEVVVSNGLTKDWLFILKGLNIVTVTLDRIEDYLDLVDIVIDFKSQDSSRYFTGEMYSVCRNKDLAFEEIVNLITKLEWDSNFWGFPVAYLSSKYLTDNILLRIEKVIKRYNIKLIEYLCNCHDSRSVKIAEKNGFHFTDIRLSFERPLNGKYDYKPPSNIAFDRAKNDDIQELREISKDLYKDSRYFFDDNFEREKVSEFYQTWIERAVLGQFDDACYCLYENGTPFGFCTLKYNVLNTASIGLFGLSKKYHGKGLAKTLLQMIFNVLSEKNIHTVFVVTQGRNYAAQKLYQSVGFSTKATELWYHKWL